MSSFPAPSALNSDTQMFPTLTLAQIDRARSYGSLRRVRAGDILFRPGDSAVSFFILLSGKLAIVQPVLDGERQITLHEAHSFTGELSMITGQRCLVLGRVAADGEFLEIPHDSLRMLVARDAEFSEIVMRAFILRRLALINNQLGNVILMGSRHSAQTLSLREFLGRNGYPYTYVDLDTDKASQELLDRFHVKVEDVPIVICDGTNVLKNPTATQLAECLGFNAEIDGSQVRDVVVVGAGPAGLAAAVYAASEGLDVLVIETNAPGGQAGSSSKIENYLGFPTGVSGQELAARATSQAQKFGARLMVAHKIVRLHCDQRPYEVELEDGSRIKTKTVVIATGAQYNKPKLENLARFEGQGVYYGATYIEAQLCTDEEAIVVGGGNSAGQAAVYLSQSSKKVYMLVRSGGLADSMSRYLIQRIMENPKIELLCDTEITRLEGDSHLERVTWKNKHTGATTERDVRHLFIMAGASPRTEWLKGCLAMDEKGFVLTGRDLTSGATQINAPWPLARAPQMLETSLPGVVAVGDVRANNVKRVASAVGEGAISIHLVHRTIGEM